MANLPAKFRPGEPVKAEWFNEIVRRLNRLENTAYDKTQFSVIDTGGGRSVSLALPGKKTAAAVPIGGLVLFRLSVFTPTKSDYFFAQEVVGGQTTATQVKIAKPWFLRGKATWDGKTRNGVTYSSFSTDNQHRVASRNIGQSTKTQKQIILPLYYRQDYILAAPMKVQKVNYEAGDPSGTGPIEIDWIDINVDGRMWALDTNI